MVSNGPSRLDEHCMCNELSTVLRSVYPEHNMARGHASSLLVDSLLRIICWNGRPTAGNELMSCDRRQPAEQRALLVSEVAVDEPARLSITHGQRAPNV